jgi:hypothetical protein
MTILPLPGAAALVVLSALALSGCRIPTAADDADILANLRFSPGAFDSFRRNTEIIYTLNQPARVTFSIVRRTGSGVDQPVLTLFTALLESKGYHSHTWLGDTSQGLFAPAGDYIGIVFVGDRRFEAAVRVFHF